MGTEIRVDDYRFAKLYWRYGALNCAFGATLREAVEKVWYLLEGDGVWVDRDRPAAFFWDGDRWVEVGRFAVEEIERQLEGTVPEVVYLPWVVVFHGPMDHYDHWCSYATQEEAVAVAASLPAHLRAEVVNR